MARRGDVTAALALTLVLMILLGGCASSPRPMTATPAVTPPPTDDEYEIQPGDLLTVKFYYHPDHNRNMVLVRPDGSITLPLVGDVHAAGLRPSELSSDLEKRYSSNLRDPVIAVSIKQVYQYLVWVGGEVKKPGFVEYQPGLTATQAMVAAGGPKDTAAIDQTLWIHKARDGYRSSRLDLAKPVVEGDTTANPVISPQDVIFVPKTTIAKINVVVDQWIVKMIPIRFTERIQDDVNNGNGNGNGNNGNEPNVKEPKSSTPKNPPSEESPSTSGGGAAPK